VLPVFESCNYICTVLLSSFLTALYSKGSGELEEESSSEDEINRRARQARGRRLDDTETGGSRHR
jgi:hypothetical protein